MLVVQSVFEGAWMHARNGTEPKVKWQFGECQPFLSRLSKEWRRMKCKDNKPCDALNSRLQSGKGKGLFECRLMSLKTGKTTRTLYYYTTGIKDKGVVLNFCPFCGFEFSYKDMSKKPSEGVNEHDDLRNMR